ncbi:MAG TPA: OmcA/MtrC family decaheme c-type cytochrome [Myxococcaceae bacterium]|nr:OmcA/MtrC family decaheme c-type cytochrome [Myxococcaceae bacterium]
MTVQSVTISSPPVVKFTVTDGSGVPITGLGNTSKSSTATVAGLTNLAFSIAKLVPGTNNAPSRWVSYIVTTVPTTTAAAAPTRPTTDNTGTLVDNGDGTYVYTFYRDVPGIKAQVAAMNVTLPDGGGPNKDDLGDLTYDPTLVHRLTIQVSGNAPGTGSNTPTGVTNVTGVPMQTPFDAIYDFVPSTGAAVTDSGRDIVATQKCNECHRQLGGIPGDPSDSSAASFHGGNRNDTKYCVVCHTDQRKYGQATATYNASTLTITSSSSYRFGGFGNVALDRAVGNFPNQIHHIHAGPVLAYSGYNYGGVLFNEVLFPQDLRNCTKCHDGSATSTAPTPEGDNWKNVPSRLACGGCHDGIDFGTGHGVTLADKAAGKTETTTFNGFAHGGFQQPDDTQCVQCHSSLRVDIDTAHRPVTPPSSGSALAVTGGNANTNAAWIASNPARLPAGAIAVTYDIKSVSVNASGQPVIVFRILQNGARKDFNDPATSTPNPATGQRELWDNFMGGPSLYFVFSVPQDGIAAPADFNASASGYLRTIWNGSATSGTGAGTLSAPDANGYYTGTLTGVKIPANAVMLTGGLGYSYNCTSTLPLTQTNLSAYPVTAPTATGLSCATSATNVCKQGGLIVIAPDAQKVATGFTARRPIVEDARCNACHQELGTFTQDAFHAGQRNDGTTCSWCHTPNRTSSGWSADSTYFVHAIHASAKRANPFTWDANSTTDSFADVTYPGVLRDCQTCHLPGTYDFSASASASALPNKQYRTVATGAFNNQAGTTITNYTYNSGSQSCVASTSAPQTPLGAFEVSPYVSNYPTTYGVGFNFNAGLAATSPSCTPDGIVVAAVPSQGTLQASASTLVNSPIAGVCVACHDSPADQAHFELSNGSIWEPRSTALSKVETCMICHGPGAIADIKVVHAQ